MKVNQMRKKLLIAATAGVLVTGAVIATGCLFLRQSNKTPSESVAVQTKIQATETQETEPSESKEENPVHNVSKNHEAVTKEVISIEDPAEDNVVKTAAKPTAKPTTKPAKPTNKPAKKTETKYAVGEALQANPYFKYGYTEYHGNGIVFMVTVEEDNSIKIKVRAKENIGGLDNIAHYISMSGTVNPYTNTFKYTNGFCQIIYNVRLGPYSEVPYRRNGTGEFIFTENGLIWNDNMTKLGRNKLYTENGEIDTTPADVTKKDEKKYDVGEPAIAPAGTKDDSKKDEKKYDVGEPAIAPADTKDDSKKDEKKYDVGEPAIAPADTKDDSKKDENKYDVGEPAIAPADTKDDSMKDEKKYDVGEPCVAPAGTTDDTSKDVKPAGEKKTDETKKDDVKPADTKKDDTKPADQKTDDKKDEESKDTKPSTKAMPRLNIGAGKTVFTGTNITFTFNVKTDCTADVEVVYKKSNSVEWVYRMSGKINERNNRLSYNNCTKTEYKITDGKRDAGKVIYTNGSGEFIILKGAVIWMDKDASFAKNKAYTPKKTAKTPVEKPDTKKDDKSSKDTKPAEPKYDVGEPCTAPEEVIEQQKKDEKEESKKNDSNKNDPKKNGSKKDDSKKHDSKKHDTKKDEAMHVSYVKYSYKETTIEMDSTNLDDVKITVTRKKAKTESIYKMSGKFDMKTFSINYDNCELTEITYKHGKPVSMKKVFKHGKGRIEFSKHENVIGWFDSNAKYAKNKAFKFAGYNK